MNKVNNYENIFRWMKKATKTERHIEELELFAKKHPIIFMKFHKEGNAIIKFIFYSFKNRFKTALIFIK